jgi:hypothetical protein
MTEQSIHTIIRDAETNFIDNPVDIGEYVSWDMHDTIETIDAYLNSKHTSGPQDSLNRDKPFFNIVTAAANIWYRATDIDRKDIKILPSKITQTGMAFIATVLLQDWMRKARFGVFLNDWGRILARYGSAVVKFVEKDGELSATVVPWNRLIVDPIDFDSIPRIEKLYKTPEQLKANKMYDQEVVEDLCNAQSARENLDGTRKDDNNKFIEIYEVHGELPEYLLTDDDFDYDKEYEYIQQMQVVSYVRGSATGDFKDYTLYRGREQKDPYMLTHLIPEDGRTLAIGAVEHLFESQWMVNHSKKNVKDTLDLASKLIFQTSDKSYVGRNALSAIETGDIMVHEANAPLTQINNSKADVTAFENYSVSWQNLGAEITSTPDAVRGTTLPSGTPYRLGAYLGGQANSLFEQMTENKGLHVEDMMRQHIIPHLKKKMNTTDEIVAILDDHNIYELDAMYVPRAARKAYNEQVKNALLNDEELPAEFDQATAEADFQGELNKLGNKRPFKPSEIESQTWKAALKDLEMNVVVEVTNEEQDKRAILQTLASLYTTTAQTNPVLANQIMSRIMTETGVFSPLQINQTANVPQQAQGGAALQDITQTQNGTEQPGVSA